MRTQRSLPVLIAVISLLIACNDSTSTASDAAMATDAAVEDATPSAGDMADLIERPQTSFAVDPTLEPRASSLPAFDDGVARPVAAIIGEDGIQAEFAANELIVVTPDPGAIDDLLDRWAGEVLASASPEVLGWGEEMHLYYVRVDPTGAKRARLQDVRVEEEGFHDAYRVSSQAGLDLLAAAATEATEHGLVVEVNWVMQGADISTRSTLEAPMGPSGYSPDAFEWSYMKRPSVQNFGVAEAWRLLDAANRLENPVTLAIMDGGFVQNPDLPPARIVPAGAWGVPNSSSCGGNPCPWHGTLVASAAMGIPDNGMGTAGPGGPVADPTFHVAMHGSTVAGLLLSLLLTPPGVGPAVPRSIGRPTVLNLSASANIPKWGCALSTVFLGKPCAVLNQTTRALRRRGTLFVASAGNDGASVDRESCFIGCWERTLVAPCELDDVLCVGGLNEASNAIHPSSNYGQGRGTSVDLYGPFVVYAPPGASPMETGRVAKAAGTSFSAPFVAGVAALVSAADPSLSPDAIEEILLETAGLLRRGAGLKVDAYAAVLRALGGNAPPYLEIVEPVDGARIEADQPGHPTVLLRALIEDDSAYDVRWTSDRDGEIGTGAHDRSARLSTGRHVIAVLVDDGTWQVERTVEVTVTNAAPRVSIALPEDGDEFVAEQAIALFGGSADAEQPFGGRLPEEAVYWLLDDEVEPIARGHLGRVPAGVLTPGPHRITFVGDDGAERSEASVAIVVAEPGDDRAPIVDIISPQSGDLGVAPAGGLPVELVGSAFDREDGALDGASMEWWVSQDGAEPVLLGTGERLNVTLSPNCFSSTFRVTLSATDSSGNRAHFTILVFASVLC